MSVSDITQGLEARRFDIERIVDAGGGVYDCAFFINIIGAGEGLAQVSFGVDFVEKPLFTAGFEMLPNQALVPGKYPSVTSGVFTWAEKRRSDNGLPLYQGASICIVATGATDLHALVHVNFQGKAVRNS